MVLDDAVFNGSDVGESNVVVRLYRDVNGDGLLDGGDLLVATNLTDAAGGYTFTVASIGAFVLDIDTNSLPAGA